jgi:hypothetical protein
VDVHEFGAGARKLRSRSPDKCLRTIHGPGGDEALLEPIALHSGKQVDVRLAATARVRQDMEDAMWIHG